ncbi:MAG: arginase family protein [Eubacteriales bacterium]|nr:arginase family protein [Eubacteriales bacterium]MDD3537089.1 arginase family protein [Eubacteriales bacterium]HPF18089.1 arginase family protein [Bacillota bacterium]
MKKKKLTVLEVPYDATVYAPGPRELDLYNKEKVYETAGLPVERITVHYEHENHPSDRDTFDSQIALGKEIAREAAAAFRRGDRVLMTGGNCGPAVAVAGALRQSFPGKRLGLIWLDAHGDLNTPETSVSGMIGGMPFGVCWGNSLPEWQAAVGLIPPFLQEDCLLSDGRSLDPPEEEMLRHSRIRFLNTDQLKDMESFSAEVRRIADRVEGLYLHIDADILDGTYVPDHKTIEYNGPGMEDVKRAIDAVMLTGKVLAYAVVSVYFPNGKPGKEISARSGLELVRQGLLGWKE